MFRICVLLLLLMVFSITSFSQINETSDKEVLFKRETSSFFSANSDGFGFGYRSGRFKTGYKFRTIEYSFSNIWDLKQVKRTNPYPGAHSYYYGKQLYLYNLKVVYGIQKTIRRKPYWGGVEIRTLLMSGLSLGFGKPIYLYVVKLDESNVPILEKYENDNILQQNIYGKGPFSKGFSEMKFFPAASFKAGLNVEFGDETEKTKSLETGLMLDAYLHPIQMMSFSPERHFFISIYLSYHFGKRFNP